MSVEVDMTEGLSSGSGDRRAALWIGGVVFAAIGAFVVWQLTAAPSMDVEKLEAEVETGILTQTGVSTSVDCPNAKAEAGYRFVCELSLGVPTLLAEHRHVMVEVLNDNGDFVWNTVP
jgi:hypothetical protein